MAEAGHWWGPRLGPGVMETGRRALGLSLAGPGATVSRSAQQGWPGTAAEKFSTTYWKGTQTKKRKKVRDLEGLEEPHAPPCLPAQEAQ